MVNNTTDQLARRNHSDDKPDIDTDQEDGSNVSIDCVRL